MSLRFLLLLSLSASLSSMHLGAPASSRRLAHDTSPDGDLMGDDIVDFGHGVVRSGGATSFLDDSLFGVWGDEVDDDKGRRRDKGKDELDTGRIEDPRGGRGADEQRHAAHGVKGGAPKKSKADRIIESADAATGGLLSFLFRPLLVDTFDHRPFLGIGSFEAQDQRRAGQSGTRKPSRGQGGLMAGMMESASEAARLAFKSLLWGNAMDEAFEGRSRRDF